MPGTTTRNHLECSSDTGRIEASGAVARGHLAPLRCHRFFVAMASHLRRPRPSLAYAAFVVAIACASVEARALAADAASLGQQSFDEGVAALDSGGFERAR